MTTNSRDRALAEQVVARFIGDGQGVPPGVLPLTLRDAITTALATRYQEGEAATWQQVLEIADNHIDRDRPNFGYGLREKLRAAALESANHES